jgi:succinate dehydrogenase / fumarate reductase cytochrome b subunit
MWLIDSSIGRKMIMGISGVMLVVFLLFHSIMNFVAIINPYAYDAISAFLGANWYALIATKGLAIGFIIHIVYAFYLTVQNRTARGKDRYAVTAKQEGVSWASENMLILGIVILGFLVLHLYHFWSKMQLVEILHMAGVHTSDEQLMLATKGAHWVKHYFSQPTYSIIYIVWLVALWYHLSHGVWSSLQSLGLNNKTWYPRIKTISTVVATIIILLFIAIPIFGLLEAGPLFSETSTYPSFPIH